jgi:hypothetical protein
MRDGQTTIDERLIRFKRKYYFNLTIKGLFLTSAFVLAYFLLASLLEYSLWLSQWARFSLFVAFFFIVFFSVYRFLKTPLAWWLYKKGLGQEESARLIGNYFPGIRDKLVNLIQLSLSRKATPLLSASIHQKSLQLEDIAFEQAVDLGDGRKYAKYLLIPLGVILAILILNRGIFTQSTARIVQFNREFSPQAPFQFTLGNKNLIAFFNEDFTLHLKIRGESLPDAVYLFSSGHRLKMETIKPDEFSYTFERIQQDFPFQFEASGFYSDPQTIILVNHPELTRLEMLLSFPAYLGKKNEQLVNSGNVEVPEGTRIKWKINATNAVRASMGFGSEPNLIPMQNVDNQLFEYQRAFRSADEYRIDLENQFGGNKDKISYTIDVIKDQYPLIDVDHMNDSALFKSIFLGGSISDDHGLTALSLNYMISKGSSPVSFEKKIPIQKNLPQQSFFYSWSLDSLGLKPGDQLSYYMEVWDNDGVHGSKSTKSHVFSFELPGEKELRASISKSQTSAEDRIEESLSKAKNIREAMDEAQQKLKGKQTLDWQDKKMLENLMDKKKDLDHMISQLQKENEMLEKKKDAFSEQNERIKEKADQIQKLMDELLDPETKKLFEELAKLLNENSDMNQIQKMLDKMNRKEINVEKELERTLELYKHLQYDYKLDQAIAEIKKQQEKQEQLLKKTEDFTQGKSNDETKDQPADKSQKNADQNQDPKKGSETGNDKNESKQSDNQSLAKEQEQLNKDFEDVQRTEDELRKMGEDLKMEDEIPSPEQNNELKDAGQQSKESLEKGQPKKSVGEQRKMVEQLKKMGQQMEGMESSMEMEIDLANLESLRNIVHGLIKLSYDQESLMKEFNQVQQTDPKYVLLAQNQLKIQDDSKVLEDSLLSLGKRDPLMESFITKEIGELNDHLDKSADHIRERRKPNASSEMQLSMTSINNLAIKLNDHYNQMMDMMASAMPSSGKKKGKKGPASPSLVQLQKDLNQRIEQLKTGNKAGRQMSEELANMAAEQERIRRALEELEQKIKNEGGKGIGNDLPGKMEQTEMDLVNKAITDQTIKRQKEIEVRLLEAEKSLREQDQDDERKGETAKDYEKEIPHAFEEYLRLREKEVELLKTVPPKLFPYYKKEVNEYFKRLGNLNY